MTATAAACRRSGRRFLGIELVEEYAHIGASRLAAAGAGEEASHVVA